MNREWRECHSYPSGSVVLRTDCSVSCPDFDSNVSSFERAVVWPSPVVDRCRAVERRVDVDLEDVESSSRLLPTVRRWSPAVKLVERRTTETDRWLTDENFLRHAKRKDSKRKDKNDCHALRVRFVSFWFSTIRFETIARVHLDSTREEKPFGKERTKVSTVDELNWCTACAKDIRRRTIENGDHRWNFSARTSAQRHGLVFNTD